MRTRVTQDLLAGADVIVYAHTHRPRIHRDRLGRLWINPGETSGWTYGDPTVVLLDTATGATDLVHLARLPPVPGEQPSGDTDVGGLRGGWPRTEW